MSGGVNSIEDCKRYRYWVDSQGEIWELRSYCEHPTASLMNMRSGEETGGAVGCKNLQGFTPLIKKEFVTDGTKNRTKD